MRANAFSARSRAALALLSLALLQGAAAQDGAPSQSTIAIDPVSLESFLVFKNRAFVIGDPILVSGPLVTSVSWSPNGQFALIERWSRPLNILDVQAATRDKTAEKPTHFLSLYSLARGQVTDIAKFSWDEGADLDVNWIPDSSVALVTSTTAVKSTDGQEHAEADLYWLDAGSGEYKELRPWSLAGTPISVEVVPSPSKSFTFLKARFPGEIVKTASGRERQTLGKLELLMMSGEGRMGAVPLPPDIRDVLPTWSSSGDVGYLRQMAQGGVSRIWLRVRPQDLKPEPTEMPANLWRGEYPVGLITVRPVPEASVNGKFSAPLNTLWLETLDPDSQSRVLLTGDGQNGEVNATMDAASFLSQGSLYIRPITEVSRARYDAATTAYRRSKALNQSRQVGLAAIMFAGDHDDVYPGANERIQDLLAPYLRDINTMNGFNYTFPGGTAGSIANPSATELGYIQFDDGRAVVYADGHARWVPNPKG